MQSVIVYRNPMEAAFWDMFMNSPNTFPVIVSVVVFFALLIGLAPVTEKLRRGSLWRATWPGYLLIAVAAAGAIATFYYMAI